MILAIALLGLSISLLHEKYNSEFNRKAWPVGDAFGRDHGPRTVRYCVFLGLYGILISAVGTLALLIGRIPTIVSLVGDSFGALCFLAGGIAWVVSIGGRKHTCSEWKDVPANEWIPIPASEWRRSPPSEWTDFLDRKSRQLNPYQEFVNKLTAWLNDAAASACRQGSAEHGLVWALFVLTTCLVVFDYLRRRDLAKSSK